MNGCRAWEVAAARITRSAKALGKSARIVLSLHYVLSLSDGQALGCPASRCCVCSLTCRRNVPGSGVHFCPGTADYARPAAQPDPDELRLQRFHAGLRRV